MADKDLIERLENVVSIYKDHTPEGDQDWNALRQEDIANDIEALITLYEKKSINIFIEKLCKLQLKDNDVLVLRLSKSPDRKFIKKLKDIQAMVEDACNVKGIRILIVNESVIDMKVLTDKGKELLKEVNDSKSII